MFITQRLRQVNRFRQWIQILLKYGLEDVVATTSLRRLVPERRSSSESFLHFSRYERIRMAIEELGPTFVKGGQVLSNRPDLLPSDLINELKKLQDSVPPVSFETIKQIIETETGKNIQHTFLKIDEKPLGSASIGQVHKAFLRSGEAVVIKVQRPNVARMIEGDLSIVREFVQLTEQFFKGQGILNPLEVVTIFEKNIKKELDYRNELANMEQFRRIYANEHQFYVPKPYKKYSTDKILVIEYVEGCKINDKEQLRFWGLSPQKLAERGLNIYLGQIFKHGYFHADPHPGNILVDKNGKINLIDFGMVGSLTQRDKFAFADLFASMSQGDARTMALNLQKLAVESEVENMRSLESSLNELIDVLEPLALESTNIAEVTNSLQRIVYEHRISLPPSIFLVLRALVVIEGIGKEMHPTLNVFKFIQPYGLSLLKQKYSLEELSKESLNLTRDFYTLFQNSPFEINSIIQKLRKGKIVVQVQEIKDEKYLQTLNHVINLGVLGLLCSSAVVGFAILAVSGQSGRFLMVFGYNVNLAFLFICFILTLLLFIFVKMRKK